MQSIRYTGCDLTSKISALAGVTDNTAAEAQLQELLLLFVIYKHRTALSPLSC